MPTLNYTTTVATERTISEIQKLLVKHGADAILTRYEDQRPVGLSFRLTTPHGVRDFTLPVNDEAVHLLLIRQGVQARYRGREHAVKVAWRVLKDWLAAQLAIIEAEMATFDQVMLPYMQMGELTVYDAYVERETSLRALTSEAIQ
jgi:hypothetical protein